MAFITAVNDVQNASGASVVVPKPDGTRSPMVLKAGAGFAVTFTQSGDLGIVTLAPDPTAVGTFSQITLPPEAAPSSPASGWTVFVDSADGRLKAKDAAGNIVIMSGLVRSTNTKTMSANNTTASIPVWGITGAVRITKLYGSVSTVMGAHHTANKFRLNDQTATSDMTTTTGNNLNAAPVGSMLLAEWDSGGSADKLINITDAAGVQNGASGSARIFEEFLVVKKTGAATNIEYVYSTTDTPTSGAIQFIVEWEPVSSDGAIAAL